MKKYRIKFHCQLGVIGMLATLGLIALCGEPAEGLSTSAWMLTYVGQVVFTINCWISAWLLSRQWRLNRKMQIIELQRKQQMKAL